MARSASLRADRGPGAESYYGNPRLALEDSGKPCHPDTKNQIVRSLTVAVRIITRIHIQVLDYFRQNDGKKRTRTV